MLLGLGVYPEKDSKAKIIEYIDLAHKQGFRSLFINLLGALGDTKQMAAISTICNHAAGLKWRVTADVSPSALKSFKVVLNTPAADKFFGDLGVNTIRLDEDFGGVLEAEFTKKNKKLSLQVNASSFTSIADNMKREGAVLSRVTACHNFYPQRETGLSIDYFDKSNAEFASLAVPVEAFLALPFKKANIGPWAGDAGLPTLELQRDRSLSFQTRLLCAGGLVSGLHIGSMYATQDELKTVARFAKDQIGFAVVTEKNISETERKITFDFDEHVIRGDIAENMLRSTMTRIKYKDESVPKRVYARKEFVRGDVVVVNDSLARYKGELQIITGKIHNDGTRNLVGRIPADELILLRYVKPWRKFALHELS